MRLRNPNGFTIPTLTELQAQWEYCSPRDFTFPVLNPNNPITKLKLANGVAEEDSPRDSLEVFRPPDKPAPKPLNFPFPRTKTATIEASMQRAVMNLHQLTTTMNNASQIGEEDLDGGGRWWQRRRKVVAGRETREWRERDERSERVLLQRGARGRRRERGLANLVP